METPQVLHSMLQSKETRKRPLKSSIPESRKKQLSVLQPVLVRGKCPFWSCLFCEGQNIMFWEIKTDWVNKCKQINESISQTMKQSVIQMINQSMKLLFFSPNLWCKATGNVQPAATAATRKRKTHICWIVIYRVDSVIRSLNNQALRNKQVSLKWKLSCLSHVRSEGFNLNHCIWTCFRSQLSCLVIVWQCGTIKLHLTVLWKIN